jgi:hypothetical protein
MSLYQLEKDVGVLKKRKWRQLKENNIKMAIKQLYYFENPTQFSSSK